MTTIKQMTFPPILQALPEHVTVNVSVLARDTMMLILAFFYPWLVNDAACVLEPFPTLCLCSPVELFSFSLIIFSCSVCLFLLPLSSDQCLLSLAPISPFLSLPPDFRGVYFLPKRFATHPQFSLIELGSL